MEDGSSMKYATYHVTYGEWSRLLSALDRITARLNRAEEQMLGCLAAMTKLAEGQQLAFDVLNKKINGDGA